MTTEFRAQQWRSWHTDGINLDKIRSVNNQVLQTQMITEITSLSHNKLNFSVLELGPADGGVCYEIMKEYTNITNYTLVDDISMLNICKDRLKNYDMINYVEIDNILTLKDIKFDLLISNHCIEETTRSYQTLVYDTFFNNVNEVFMLCNTAYSSTWGEFDPAYLETRMIEHFNTTITDGHRLSRNTQKIFYGYKL